MEDWPNKRWVKGKKASLPFYSSVHFFHLIITINFVTWTPKPNTLFTFFPLNINFTLLMEMKLLLEIIDPAYASFPLFSSIVVSHFVTLFLQFLHLRSLKKSHHFGRASESWGFGSMGQSVKLYLKIPKIFLIIEIIFPVWWILPLFFFLICPPPLCPGNPLPC